MANRKYCIILSIDVNESQTFFSIKYKALILNIWYGTWVIK